jgi:hypothetical protein
MAIVMLGMLLVYVTLALAFWWDGFFRHWGPRLEVTRTAMYLPVAECLWSVAPWTRLAVLLLTAVSLGWCGVAFLRGHPLARLATLFASLGLFLPQGRHLYVYLVGLRHHSSIVAGLIVGLIVVAPALLMAVMGVGRRYREAEHSLEWARLAYGRTRLVATGVFLAWLFFVVDAYLSYGDYIGSDLGFLMGWSTMTLAVVTLVGILKLRTWALFGTLGVAGATSALLLLGRGEARAHGYFGSESTWAHDWIVGLFLFPLVVVVALTAPFLRGLVRHALHPRDAASLPPRAPLE